MTRLIQRLDEIEQRIVAAPQPLDADRWTDSNSGVWDAVRGPQGKSLHVSGWTWSFIQHSLADLAYLARLLRMVAEAACDGANEGVDDDGWTCAVSDADPSDWCLPCRIRRAGEVGL